MEQAQLNWITNFIWGIADDVLRDLYVRGKYRDVILPMTVLRRLDAVLEPTKLAVIEMKAALDAAEVTNQDPALRQAAGQAFYNASKFSLRDLRARTSQQQLQADFKAYLDGFSPNVQEILECFEFRNQIPRLSKADALGTLIEKLLDVQVNLGPAPVLNADGSVRLPGLDNHAMGTVFEELVRRFNEENNEEAGEHWTPRDAVKLMARLIFLPIADQIESGSYLLYDGACGTGGMLTVAEETLQELAAEHGKQVAAHLYGQEINAETYAIAKADMLLKGDGEGADNIVGGPEYSTLANDAFPSLEFDFMLSNPPYGKSWKGDLERMGGKGDVTDRRFMIEHGGDPEYSLVTRSSDGQMLFLANLVSKMKHGTALGSRIAEVHNGSSLFTGDAGSGESNIRRWVIENDWLEAIVALPLNMFYNTGIATYIWVVTNRKPAHRRGKVQLIDATGWSKPLRKNMGMKNCELSDEDIARICETFLALEETKQSKIFPNAAFGYWKVTVERPLRLRVDLSPAVRAAFRAACVEGGEEPLAKLVDKAVDTLGAGPHDDYNAFMAVLDSLADGAGVKLTAKRLKLLQAALGQRDEAAAPVIKKVYKPGKAEVDPLRGRFEETVGGKRCVVEYEPDVDLRDSEQVPLLEDGGIAAFLGREVLPHVPDAWFDADSVKIGYEVNFNRYFFKPKPLRTLDEIRGDIMALERELRICSLGSSEDAEMIDYFETPAETHDQDRAWFGRTPEHWQLRRLKVLLQERVQKGFPNEPLLAATQTKGVVRKEQYENRTVIAQKDFHLLKLVEIGDFVISLRSFQGGIEYARDRGIISSAYTVLYLVDASTHGYLAWFFKSQPFIDHLALFVTGIRQGQNIDYEKLGRSYVPLPPRSERDEIAHTLDTADRLIRRYIKTKRRLIALLEEQKQAIIHNAVTQGLNPAVPTKPSAIAWLENIPAHWEERPLVRCCIERADYRGATPPKTDTGIFLVTAKNVRKGWIDYNASSEYVSPDSYDRIMRRGLPKIGDLLFTTEAPLGHFALVDREDVALAQRIIRFRLDPSIALSQFALHAVLSPYFQNQLNSRATGSTAVGIKASKLPQLSLLIPPLEEQQPILDRISRDVAPLDALKASAMEEIKLLDEYRIRLIADVVTGKLDVRDVVVQVSGKLGQLGDDLDLQEDENESTNDLDLEEVAL